MAGVKGNRKILYTKKVLKDSLLKLLETKDIHQVTVTDLCKQADVNRGTFYAHYKDAYDLLESMENELFSQVVQYIEDTPVEQYFDSLLINVLDLIKENKELCKILLFRQRDNKLLDKLFCIAYEAGLKEVYQETALYSETNFNYYIKYVVGGCIAIIQTWLENDFPESSVELARVINSVSVLASSYHSYIQK
ncbi:MAG: TetR family transcriptional regulator [Lachnospiraceae bacterium]|nr:TetR family transcriptional regulator [Lachnospiraceae bacterium]